MNLSIIIVSYNTSTLLKQCLSSVFQSLKYTSFKDNSELIVIDNASSDDSCPMVKKYFPKVHLIYNKKNLGFAAANNQGISKAGGEYILLLNSDTTLKKDTLKILLSKMEGNKNIAVLGGKLLNSDGSLQPSVGFFPNLFKIFLWMSFLDDIPLISKFIKPYHVEDKNYYETDRKVDWVSGACFMVRKEVTEKVGLLDEKIFMYGEEMEWCYRIKRAGYEVSYTPEAEIFHYKGKSSPGSEAAGIDQEFCSLIYFYRKHKPFLQLPILKGFLIFGALLRIGLFGIIRKYPTRIPRYAKALKMVGQ